MNTKPFFLWKVGIVASGGTEMKFILIFSSECMRPLPSTFPKMSKCPFKNDGSGSSWSAKTWHPWFNSVQGPMSAHVFCHFVLFTIYYLLSNYLLMCFYDRTIYRWCLCYQNVSWGTSRLRARVPFDYLILSHLDINILQIYFICILLFLQFNVVTLNCCCIGSFLNSKGQKDHKKNHCHTWTLNMRLQPAAD